MFIIRLLFYALEGFMGSSFLTTINVSLSLISILLLMRIVLQFGLPNHPGKFLVYLVTICLASFFTLKAMVDLNFISEIDYFRWRPFFMTTGILGVLLQLILVVGNFGQLQMKIVSRIPILAGLVLGSIFPSKAESFFVIIFLVSVLFLIISVGKGIYQRRIFFKMSLFLGLNFIFNYFFENWPYSFGEIFLFPAIFYFYIFQKTCGISTLFSFEE